MAQIFRFAASMVNLYSLICFARIIITWFPGASYSSIGKLLSAICDPFLNLFRGIKWLRLGMVDFSPMVAIGILTIVSTVLSGIAVTGNIYFGGIIALIVNVVWSVISSLATFLLIVLIVRYLVMCFSKNSNYYGSIWSQLDGALSPLVFRITRFFTGGKNSNYKNSLLIAIIMLIVLIVAGRFVIGFLIVLIQRIPI